MPLSSVSGLSGDDQPSMFHYLRNEEEEEEEEKEEEEEEEEKNRKNIKKENGERN